MTADRDKRSSSLGRSLSGSKSKRIHHGSHNSVSLPPEKRHRHHSRTPDCKRKETTEPPNEANFRPSYSPLPKAFDLSHERGAQELNLETVKEDCKASPSSSSRASCSVARDAETDTLNFEKWDDVSKKRMHSSFQEMALCQISDDQMLESSQFPRSSYPPPPVLPLDVDFVCAELEQSCQALDIQELVYVNLIKSKSSTNLELQDGLNQLLMLRNAVARNQRILTSLQWVYDYSHSKERHCGTLSDIRKKY